MPELLTHPALEPEHIGRMLAGLAARGTLSPSTVRYAYSVLRTALGRALKQGKVIRNVATLVDPPAKGQREIRPLGRDQVRAFLEGIHGDSREALYVGPAARDCARVSCWPSDGPTSTWSAAS